jgi:hypothetical protein
LSEDEGAAEEYEGGRPLGLYLLVGVIVALVAVSGMFAIGYIPPLAKIGNHTTSTTRTGSVQFITVTSTYPGPTTTTTLPATTVTNSTTITKTTISPSTSTSTLTSTQTVTSTSVSTSTASTTVYTSTITTSTSTTFTTTTTTTTTIAPLGPLAMSVTLTPAGTPATLRPGESFLLNVTVQSKLPSTFASLTAYQDTPGNTPVVVSFFPDLPESLTPVVGTSYYTVSGTVSQNAPIGSYVLNVELNANSPVNNTQMSLTKQFIINLIEPLSFIGFKFVKPNSQFNGTCAQLPLGTVSIPTWVYQCKINAAPMVNGTMDFNVTNSANVPICIQTSFGSSSMNAFVNMNPYPFCPNGAPGVYVPADRSNYVFTYTIENGDTAGAQTAFFTFERLAT